MEMIGHESERAIPGQIELLDGESENGEEQGIGFDSEIEVGDKWRRSVKRWLRFLLLFVGLGMNFTPNPDSLSYVTSPT